MRAHFIRGENPKAAMDIGDKILRIKDRMERAAQILCHDFELDFNTIKSSIDERGINVQFEGKKPNILYPYDYWIWYDKEREHYWSGYSNANGDIEDQKPTDSLERAMLEVRIFLSKYNWRTPKELNIYESTICKR
jgi:hypothetical protein